MSETNSNIKWVRIFDIPDITKHRKGFTIYKVISMLYPESCMDAVIKLTVWKRYNDFRKLHKEIKTLCKKLPIKDKPPDLPAGSYLRRFDEVVVEERKESILRFLEFIGANQKLFTSTEFNDFFKVGYIPSDQLQSNINLIRSDLNLPEDLLSISANSDDECLSDSDSFTMSSNMSVQDENMECANHRTLRKQERQNSNSSTSSKYSDSLSITTLDGIPWIDEHIHHSLSPDSYVQYIVDASMHVNIASELATNKKYEEAFVAYKAALDILITYGKEDKNYERRQLVRRLTNKYLLRAEKIYNMFLAPEVKCLETLMENQGIDHHLVKPKFDIFKYKVLKASAKGILALDSQSQQIIYIKVINKIVHFVEDELILPDDVPFMVKLVDYYSNENSIFLVLEHCSGLLIIDRIKTKPFTTNSTLKIDYAETTLNFSNEALSDHFETDFDELINSYKESTLENRISQQENSNPNQQRTNFFNSDEFDDIPDSMFFKNKGRKNYDLDKEFTKKFSLESEDQEGLSPTYQKSFFRNTSCSGSIDDNFDEPPTLAPLNIIVKWIAQLVVALEKLHVLGVVCKDLQMHNLLVDDNDDLCLTYMCNVKDQNQIFVKDCPTSLPPELYSIEDVSEDADWWCLGVILYELLVGFPLSIIHPLGLSSSSVLRIPKYVFPEGRSLLKQLLISSPSERLGSGKYGIENLKSHPFFSKIKWDVFCDK